MIFEVSPVFLLDGGQSTTNGSACRGDTSDHSSAGAIEDLLWTRCSPDSALYSTDKAVVLHLRSSTARWIGHTSRTKVLVVWRRTGVAFSIVIVVIIVVVFAFTPYPSN